MLAKQQEWRGATARTVGQAGNGLCPARCTTCHPSPLANTHAASRFSHRLTMLHSRILPCDNSGGSCSS